MLAAMPDERVDHIIDTHGLPERTVNTITDRDVLHKELATVHEQGYALNDSERIEGMRGIGVPSVVRKAEDCSAPCRSPVQQTGSKENTFGQSSPNYSSERPKK
ncbi:IclR family transcriptional regulator domain-containing protein [Halocatena pleomorpha]|uniref:IclR-ED domain-containing protein n=1 Tax=Halocatena pleomorpha TaxID=1785090 RepID=A0A3P3RE90_9EURY|nr:IclR family transcriptional regulator C-terminal domain-containing protein [Halocatena pleomorpha]RRJ31817.1 hypothetical protein EIK79_06010 [Halocatena pleomorpha]